MRHITFFILATLTIITPTFAQPLADKVPDDAIVYVGWCGSASMPSGYDGSHLKAVLDSSNIPAVVNDVIPRLISRVMIQNREAGMKLQMLTTTIGPLLKYPTAIYFSGMDFSKQPPLPKFGIICKAGAETASLAERFNQLKQMSGNSPPITVIADQDTLTILFGVSQIDPATKPLADLATFKSTLANAQSNPALIVYGDAEKFLAFMDQGFQHDSPRDQQHWRSVRDASGLTGVKQLVITAGFDGKDWSQQCFIAAPSPRKGMLAIADSSPITPDLLKTVPATATHFSIFTFDVGDFVSRLRTLAGQIDPQAQMNFDRAMGFATAMIGKNFQTDVIGPLGGQWVVYTDPTLTGQGLGGIVIINKLKDAAKAKDGLNALGIFISNMANGQLRRNNMQLTLRQTKVDDIEVTYFATPLITPAWAIKDGNLYFGLYPQTVVAAAKYAGKSILDNSDFVALQQRLGAEGKNITSIQYTDLPKTAIESYQTTLMLSRLLLGAGDLFGANSSEPVLPMLGDLMPQLAPAGAIGWTDDAGLHAKGLSPFPGSTLLSGSQSVIVPLVATQTAIILPALNRARETANRVKSASNLRQIGQGILLWSNERKGQYPPTLGDLLDEEISIEVFVDPRKDTSIPPQIRSGDKKTQTDWINSNSDYAYIGKGMNNSASPETIVAYEKPENLKDGINILYGDGHVEFQLMVPAMQQIEQEQQNGGAK